MSATVAVRTFGEAERAVTEHVPSLVEERFASRLFDRDATLWGPEAEDEASKRLAWVGLFESSRPLLSVIEPVRAACAESGLDRVVLCGMGGSSLAPEVICGTEGVDLVVLDSSHPDQVRAALGGDGDLERTVVVVSSKSGGTVETDSQRRAFEHAFRAADLDPVQHVVVVTDPGSPLQEQSDQAGLRVIAADPDVGGRYSALTAFGLVPSAVAGADVARLLDDASRAAPLLSRDDESNPGLVLGAAMAGLLGDDRRDKLVLVDEGSGIVGFPAWAEQLIAESTGKDGTGVLPVVVDGTGDPEVQWPAKDVTVAHLVGDAGTASAPDDGAHVAVSGTLGGQLLLWEVATAVAGRLLGINPFDQPDVESAKKAARSLLEDPPEDTGPAGSDAVTVTGLGGDWLDEGASLPAAVSALLEQLDPDRGYLAVMAYLDRWEHADLEQVRETLARRTERPVTFGWGPRFLHSTGQFHKGGPPTGVYLQVTDTPREDLAVPDRDFGFGTLIAAQAAGDARVLADHGRPVLRVHLADREAGLSALREALQGAGDPA